MTRTRARMGLAFGVIVVACSPSAGPDAVAIDLPGAEVTLSQLSDEIQRKAPDLFAAADVDSAALAFAEGYLDKLLLSREAYARPRGDTTGLGDRVRRVREAKVIEVLRDEVTGDLTDEKLDTMFGWMAKELRVRHIQTSALRDAEAALADLERGASFETLVEERSMDAFSKIQGGELPWFGFGEFPGVDEAAFSLEVGEVSKPVLSHRGWHVLRLEEVRPRSEIPATSPEFVSRTRKRIGDQRLRQRLQSMVERQSIGWHQDAISLFSEVLITFERAARQKRAEVEERRKAGGPLDISDLTFERAPTFSPEQADLPIASSETYRFTIGDAAERYASVPVEQLPQTYDEKNVDAWVTDAVRFDVAARWAANGGLAPDRDAERRVRDAVDFVYVEHLYKTEVHDKVIADEDDRREFFERFKDSYRWRPDLKVTIVRTEDELVADEARDALLAGATVDAVREKFAPDSTLVVVSTPFVRNFDSVEGIAEPLTGFSSVVRGLSDEAGGVTPRQVVGGRHTVARIDAVGESAPVTYEEAEPMVAEHCIAYLRETRLRALLDSLRTAHSASVDSAVVVHVHPRPKDRS